MLLASTNNFHSCRSTFESNLLTALWIRPQSENSRQYPRDTVVLPADTGKENRKSPCITKVDNTELRKPTGNVRMP